MAFISNKKRDKLINSINNNYTLRKILCLVTIVLFVLTFLAFIGSMLGTIIKYEQLRQTTADEQQICEQLSNTWYSLLTVVSHGEDGTITIGWSIVSIVLLCVFVFTSMLGILTIIFTFTAKSPRDTKERMKIIESSPISGKKIEKNQTASEVMAERRTLHQVREANKK